MKKVLILISTYNGEKYIEEQLDSILNQTYKNIDIYIRDDGSTDNTVSILKKYEKKYNNITLEIGKNKGFLKSFFGMLKDSDRYDYYAFCDQDDVWLNDKIEKAVKKLSKENDNKILLYASNYDYYDANMNFKSHSLGLGKTPSFAKAIVENIAPGMTMVINNATRDKIIYNDYSKCLLHDWWVYLLCSGLGKVIYDDSVTVKYRRHEKNVTKVEGSPIKKFIWRFKTFILSDHFVELRKQLISFNDIYYDQLKKKNKKLLVLFCRKKTPITQLQKFFYPVRFKDRISHELMIRAMFLIWKI
jgi:rhamnosyltransferase